jgi:multidrug efflux system membrane fusion protein
LFVNVELVLSTQKDAIVIPSQAITNGQQGQYVYVVKPDSSVESHPVIVDRSIGTDAIISKGVQAGDMVVTDGQVRILPKSKVKIITAESKAK